VASEGHQGGLTIGGRGQGLGRAPGGESSLWPPSDSLSILVWVFVSSNSKNISCEVSETQKHQKIGNWHCGILSIG
jgi:hypothetical protein